MSLPLAIRFEDADQPGRRIGRVRDRDAEENDAGAGSQPAAHREVTKSLSKVTRRRPSELASARTSTSPVV